MLFRWPAAISRTGGGISIFELLPEAPLGIPLLAWVGGAIWLVIVALMFK